MLKRHFVADLFLFALLAVLYTSCGETDNGGAPPKMTYNDAEQAMLKQGQEIAQAGFKVLSARLAAAIEKDGVNGAIPVCKEAAMSITDSLSKAVGLDVRRTSHKVRNIANAPDGIDKLMADYFTNFIDADKQWKPVLLPMKTRKEYRGYYPIIMNGQCSSCHGVVEKDIPNDAYELILQQYPSDQAVNFFPGSLRGMWVVTFNEDPAEVSGS